MINVCIQIYTHRYVSLEIFLLQFVFGNEAIRITSFSRNVVFEMFNQLPRTCIEILIDTDRLHSEILNSEAGKQTSDSV